MTNEASEPLLHDRDGALTDERDGPRGSARRGTRHVLNTSRIDSRLAAGLLGLLLLLRPAPGSPATMPAIRMKIVDAQDGSPVAGANVLFIGTAHEGTLTGHGGRGANLFASETMTDDAGELRIPKQEFSGQPFF